MPVHRVAPDPDNPRRISRLKSQDFGRAGGPSGEVADDSFQGMAQRLVSNDTGGGNSGARTGNGDVSFLKKLRKRECVAFVPVDGTQEADTLCMCGLRRDIHPVSAYTHHKCKLPWLYKTHTQLMPTDAYGQMEFLGFRQKFANYVRLDVNTPIYKMLEMLTKVWHIDPPNMLITVTGGAKTFKLKPRLKFMFRNGLRKIAKSTSAWIVSGGMYAGVMRLVGEAVSDYDSMSQKKSVAIGIAPWGCVQNRDSLINENREGEAAQYRIETDVPSESPLDPNHTHFIFVDNGTTHKFGTEITLRAKLEEAVSSSMSTASGGSNRKGVKVPIVMVVLEGGPGTLETVYQAIQKGTPAVIVEGSGRAADILAYAYNNAHEEEITVTDHNGKQFRRKIMGIAADIEADISDKIQDAFGNKNLTTWVGWVKESIQKYDLLTIFSEDDKDLDLSILQALLKANKDQQLDQLQLALSWDRIDVAKSEIFQDDREWKTGELEEVMMTAILLDRVEFVDLFLDSGVSLKQFLTVDALLTLYNQIPKKCLLYSLLCKVKRDKIQLPMVMKTKSSIQKSEKKKKNRYFFTLEDVGRLIKLLIGDFYEPLYLVIPALKNAIPSNISGECNVMEGDAIRRPERELFVWSLLMNRPDMALYFWNIGKDPLCAALFANKLLISLRDRTFDTDLKSFTDDHARTYAELAIGVITECHSVDEGQARMLLVCKLNYWGKTTNLEMAVEAENKQFIAHPACQGLLNTIWYSNLSINNYFFMILLAAVFPPFLFLLKYVRSPGLGDQEEHTLNEVENSELLQQREKEKELEKERLEKLAPLAENQEGMEMEEKTDADPEESPKKALDTNPVVLLQAPKISATKKMVHFFNAPIVRFSYNVIFYIAFLLIYSYHLLVTLNPSEPPEIIEYILIVWVITMIIEEIRQFITGSNASVGYKLKNYIEDTWNLADLVTILLFTTGLVLRFIAWYDIGTPNTIDGARVVFAINIVTFYLRLLHIFSVNKNLGPKLVMIGRMIVDLLYFVGILMVFVVSYGIATQSLIDPNTEFNPSIVIKIFQKAFFQIFGELFLEDIEAAESDTAKVVVPVLLGLYMLLTNVLLLNLLIAMFSYTFTMVQDNTDIHWYFQRYSLIYEYYERPFFPPPFIIISHLYRFFKCVLRCCKTKHDMGFSKAFDLDGDDDKSMSVWEDVSRDEYNRKKLEKEMKSVDYQVAQTADKVEQLSLRMDQLSQNKFGGGGGGASSSNAVVAAGNKMNKVLDFRLKRVEEHLGITFEALDYLVKALHENNLGAKTAQPPQIPNLKKEKKEDQEREAAEAAREREMVKKMIEKRVEIHAKSRVSPYPESQVHRFTVPDEKVPWEISFRDYYPVTYTSTKVLKHPPWADPIDLLQLKPASRPTLAWHKYDASLKIDRTSYLGEYQIRDGLPINPKGRTGIIGRGLLGRWGPNHAGDPVVTRWKRDQDGNQLMEEEKPLLEFAAIQRRDNRQWSFPGGICEPGQNVSQTLKKEFTEEAMAGDEGNALSRQKIEELFAGGEEVYRGYADDPRNTDNSWIETRVVHYHDETGDILKHLKLRAGVTEIVVTWLTASSKISMYGSHQYFMQKVVGKMNCAF